MEGDILKLQGITETHEMELQKLVGEAGAFKSRIQKLEMQLEGSKNQNLSFHVLNGPTGVVFGLIFMIFLIVVLLKQT